MALMERPNYGRDPEGRRPCGVEPVKLCNLMTDELLDLRNELKRGTSKEATATAIAAIDEELRRKYGV